MFGDLVSYVQNILFFVYQAGYFWYDTDMSLFFFLHTLCFCFRCNNKSHILGKQKKDIVLKYHFGKSESHP